MRSNLDDYDFDHIGFNYQMTEMQGALGLRQLERLAKQNTLRRKNAAAYRRLFADTEVRFQSEDNDSYNVYCYLTGLLPEKLKNKREEFISKVLAAHIPIKKQYPLALPETTICKSLLAGKNSRTPVANNISQRVFNLYVNPGLDNTDIVSMAKIIIRIYRKLGGK